MKIKIYYFSGTGNTAYVVEKVKFGLELLGNTVICESCENYNLANDDYDVLGIAFPIYASFAPKIFKDFLKKLPPGNDTPLFGLVTCGYIAGDVLNYEGKLLEDKGYIPFLYRSILVGNNLNLPRLSPLKVASEKTIEKRVPNIEKSLIEICQEINYETNKTSSSTFFGKIFGGTQRRIVGIHEKLNFKGFHADESCVKCGWCVRNCPNNNITLEDDTIKFKENCMICMRCYNFCPKEAIQMTEKTKNKKKYKRYSGPEGLKFRTRFN